jgi:hypothetical protein
MSFRAPLFARRVATAAPIPEAAPVMSTTRSLNAFIPQP